jgi:hypothetical protein
MSLISHYSPHSLSEAPSLGAQKTIINTVKPLFQDVHCLLHGAPDRSVYFNLLAAHSTIGQRVILAQIINLSTRFFSSRIWGIKSLDSLVVILAAMTDRETPQARPKAVLLGTYT